MKLRSFSIKNFRSIHETPELSIGKSLTLIGPNNEGKSNIVRAVVTALEILKWHAQEFSSARNFHLARLRAPITRRSRQIYNWDLDYPKGLQGKRGGQSVFKLTFELTENDRNAFKDEIKSTINSELPIEISVGRGPPNFRVIKRGPGGQTLTDKSKRVARFIGSRVDINHIEAVRKAEDAHSVVEAVVSRALAGIEHYEELKSALSTIARIQQPVLDEIQSVLAFSLKKFLPSVQAVTIKAANESRLSALRSVDILIDDGQSTPLAQKGDGVISLTALALLTGIGLEEGALTTSKSELGNTVLAIEEPESHLHPTAIHYIRQVVDNIASDKQIIITTHSPLLVNRSDLSSNIIVEGNKAIVCTHISEIRDSLGIKTSDNLSSARLVCICEGEDDVDKICMIFENLFPDIHSSICDGDLSIQSIGGASKLSYHATLLRNSICDVVALLDDDESGHDAWEKVRESNLLSSDEVFFTSVEGKKDAELEDMLDAKWLQNFIHTTYGVDVKAIRSAQKPEKFSERLKMAFKNHGKPFDDKIKMQVKNAVSKAVVAAGMPSVDTSLLGPIRALAVQLRRKLGLSDEQELPLLSS